MGQICQSSLRIICASQRASGDLSKSFQALPVTVEGRSAEIMLLLIYDV